MDGSGRRRVSFVSITRERARRQGAIDPLIDLPVEMVWGLSLTMLLLERSYWMVSYFFLIHQTKEMH